MWTLALSSEVHGLDESGRFQHARCGPGWRIKGASRPRCQDEFGPLCRDLLRRWAHLARAFSARGRMHLVPRLRSSQVHTHEASSRMGATISLGACNPRSA